jgi:general secretion pathway protein A
MQKKAQGKKIIVLIDEAQNLNINVLEQLRLLSNLETNRTKLLQIILVGQPELSEMLNSHELRQLGQRITLSYQLKPLTFSETKEYIQYRISIAAQKTAIKFDRFAYRHIYRYSKGIPRLINILCDRALLTAFVLNQFKITGNIAKTSIKELTNRGQAKSYSLSTGRWVLISLSFLSILFLAAVAYHPIVNRIKSMVNPSIEPQTEHIAPAESTKQATENLFRQQPSPTNVNSVETRLADSPPARTSLADYLMHMDGRNSRQTALTHIMDLWKIRAEFKPYLNSVDDETFFRLAAKSHGMVIHRVETDMDLLQKLNLPAILEFYPPGSSTPGYLSLNQMDDNKIILQGNDETDWIFTDLEELEFYWSGIAYLPWKNYHSIWGTIPVQNYEDSIITLKLLLHDIGFENVFINDEYDGLTQQAVEKIQAKYGIPVDGFVGPLTKIILYKEKDVFEMPQLRK